MTINIRPVDVAYINQTWPLVESYIRESTEKGEDKTAQCYNADHIRMYVTSGQWVLLVATDENNAIQGAMTLSFINYPMHRVAFVTSTGGKGVLNKDTFNQLKTIAKQYGATKIQAMARPSMARLLQTCEFEPRNTLMEFTL